MSTTPDKLVERYLKHLEVELDDLPRDRRREIVDEIAGHIAEARPGSSTRPRRTCATSSKVSATRRTSPRTRVSGSRSADCAGSGAYKPGWMEVGALIMLLVGGIVIPLFGWVIGVVLLWVSNAWNVRDKIIGTRVLCRVGSVSRSSSSCPA